MRKIWKGCVIFHKPEANDLQNFLEFFQTSRVQSIAKWTNSKVIDNTDRRIKKGGQKGT